uniref:Uncharacterized protein n=1 Tax=Rhizophora mucronata TaxID=61149 RepID=A0A2P2R0W6_RHIMU
MTLTNWLKLLEVLCLSVGNLFSVLVLTC